MTRCWAIAVLTIRGAIRSRMVLLLLILVGLVVFAVPRIVRGDGTVTGEFVILTQYTLGFSFFLLSLATLWAGCASVSVEWQNQRLHLVLCKPTHPFQIWLGKWLGLLVLDAVLLVFVAAMTAAQIHARLRSAGGDPATREIVERELLVARRGLRAKTVDVEYAARRELESRRALGQLPDGVPEDEVLREIRRTLLIDALTARPGASVTWTYPQPGLICNGDVLLRYRYASSHLGLMPIRGRWILQREGRRPIEQVSEAPPQYWATLSLQSLELADGGDLTITFVNESEEGVTVIFDPNDGLSALVIATTLARNYLRAVLLLFARLALFAAVGVTAGSLFSMPVAVFFSGFMLVMVLASSELPGLAESYVVRPEQKPPVRLFNWAASGILRALAVAMRPVRGEPTLEHLATGRLLEDVLRLGFTQMILYPALLAALGAWIMRRREAGLAERI